MIKIKVLIFVAVIAVLSFCAGNAGFHYKTPVEQWSFMYGRWEVRAKILGLNGVVNAFCPIRDDRSSDSSWSELDIEITGIRPDRIESCAHIYTNLTWKERHYLWQPHLFCANLSNDYHTYSIEWAPDYVVWRVDGIPFRAAHRTDRGIRERSFKRCGMNFNEFDENKTVRDTVYTLDWLKEYRTRQMRFAFDVWRGGGEEWVGKEDPEINNSAVYFSWFKYYRYEQGKGLNGTDFVLEDYDDFSGNGTDFDKNRWADAYNVFMKNGKAVAFLGDSILNFKNVIPLDPGDTAASKPSDFHKSISW